MKAALLFAGSGPLVILTSHASLTDPVFLGKLRAKGIDKFIAYEMPLAMAEQRYVGHFRAVMRDLRQADDLRVLDFNGDLISASASTDSIEFAYRSSAQTLAVVERPPQRVEIDGEEAHPPLHGSVLTLPRGQHLVALW